MTITKVTTVSCKCGNVTVIAKMKAGGAIYAELRNDESTTDHIQWLKDIREAVDQVLAEVACTLE